MQQLQLMLFDTDSTGTLSEYQLEEYFRSLVPECPLLQEVEVRREEGACLHALANRLRLQEVEIQEACMLTSAARLHLGCSKYKAALSKEASN
eukprot:1141808-Pelagomonas_calceolata.AAC.1